MSPKIERAVSVALEKLGYSQLHPRKYPREQYEVAQQFFQIRKSWVT